MPTKRFEKERTYRKGDEHSGGAGSRGGGGKKRRPLEGWEKADLLRGMDTEHTAHDFPMKPGRRHRKIAPPAGSQRRRDRAGERGGSAPGARKRGVAEVPLYVLIRSDQPTAVKEDIRRRAREILMRKLAKHSRRTERASLRLDDVNGPRGGLDKICRIKVVRPRRQSVVVTETGPDPITAVQAAADRLGRLMGRDKRSFRARSGRNIDRIDCWGA